MVYIPLTIVHSKLSNSLKHSAVGKTVLDGRFTTKN